MSGSDAVEGLGASVSDTKAGNHLVEYEQRAVGFGDAPQSVQEPVCGRDDPHIAGHRFDYHGRDVAGPGVEQDLYRLQFVVGRDQGFGGIGFRNSGAGGNPVSQRTRSGLHQQTVGVPVVVAGEFHNLGAAGKRPSQTQRGHAGLGSRIDQANHVHGRQRLAYHLGKLDFLLHRSAERRAACRGSLHRVDDDRMGMTERERSPGSQVVDIFVAVNVPDAGAVPASDEWGCSFHGAKRTHGTVDAAGDESLRPFE